MNRIEVRNVSKLLGGRRIIDDLSLTVRRGDIYGFLGPNGAGKTTTLRMVLGLIRPDSGCIAVCGQKLASDPTRALSTTGALVESPRFFESMSARENLKLGARLIAGIEKGRVDEVLDIVGLSGRADDRVRTYSLGMKQRLGIANALLGEPSVVILDEPTNGLDPQGMIEVRELIGRLARERETTFLVSSHLLHEIETMCNRVGVISDGRLVAEGSVSELLSGSQETCEVQADDVKAAEAVLASLDYVRVVGRTDDGVLVSTAGADTADLIRDLVSRDVRVSYVIPRREALESVFMQITGGNDDVVSTVRQ